MASKQWKYEELQNYARKYNKIPILCLRKPGKKRRLAVVDMDNLVSILKGKDLIKDGENSEKILLFIIK